MFWLWTEVDRHNLILAKGIAIRLGQFNDHLQMLVYFASTQKMQVQVCIIFPRFSLVITHAQPTSVLKSTCRLGWTLVTPTALPSSCWTKPSAVSVPVTREDRQWKLTPQPFHNPQPPLFSVCRAWPSCNIHTGRLRGKPVARTLCRSSCWRLSGCFCW